MCVCVCVCVCVCDSESERDRTFCNLSTKGANPTPLHSGFEYL